MRLPKKQREVVHTSASQITTFVSCNRKWWLEKVAGQPSPSTGSLELGNLVHDVVEVRLLTADWKKAATFLLKEGEKLGKKGYPKGLSANQIMSISMSHSEKFPATPVDKACVEAKFRLELPEMAYPAIGFIDWVEVREQRVSDHKTNSNSLYKLGEAALLRNIQGIIYDRVARQMPEFDADGTIKFRHLYYPTSHKSSATASEVEYTRAHADDRFGEIAEITHSIKEHAGIDQFRDTRPDTNACGYFGGCPFKAYCQAIGTPVGKASNIFDKNPEQRSTQPQKEQKATGGEVSPKEKRMSFLDRVRKGKKAKPAAPKTEAAEVEEQEAEEDSSTAPPPRRKKKRVREPQAEARPQIAEPAPEEDEEEPEEEAAPAPTPERRRKKAKARRRPEPATEPEEDYEESLEDGWGDEDIAELTATAEAAAPPEAATKKPKPAASKPAADKPASITPASAKTSTFAKKAKKKKVAAEAKQVVKEAAAEAKPEAKPEDTKDAWNDLGKDHGLEEKDNPLNTVTFGKALAAHEGRDSSGTLLLIGCHSRKREKTEGYRYFDEWVRPFVEAAMENAGALHYALPPMDYGKGRAQVELAVSLWIEDGGVMPTTMVVDRRHPLADSVLPTLIKYYDDVIERTY